MSRLNDLRCTANPSRLLARVGDVIEIACKDCSRAARDAGRPVLRVLHRFDLAGELLETVEVERPANRPHGVR